jgi:hypothetical protein
MSLHVGIVVMYSHEPLLFLLSFCLDKQVCQAATKEQNRRGRKGRGCEEKAKKEESEMSCTNCKKTFKSLLGLKYHLGKFHLASIRQCS